VREVSAATRARVVRRLTVAAALTGLTLAVTLARPAAAANRPPGRIVVTDVAYAPAEPAGDRGHLLDLYLPAGRGTLRRPLVIFSRGSGWSAANGRDDAAGVAAALIPRGYAVAGVAVRSSSAARFPAQVYDIKAAIRWLRSHARQYGLDPDRFAIAGESSGGWVAAMAAVTGDVPELEGALGVTGVSSRVQAAVPFYPPVDFLQMDAHMIDCGFLHREFGLRDCHSDRSSPESRLLGCAVQSCPGAVARANPVTYVSDDDPPIAVVHGTADLLVPHHQGRLLYDALQAACREAVLYTVPGAPHGWPFWGRWLRGVHLPRTDDGPTTVSATRGCRDTGDVTAGEPTWDRLAGFLDRALHRRTMTIDTGVALPPAHLPKPAVKPLSSWRRPIA
jgi:acetyl esterase/lipase